jgi:hypothetical protein
MNVYSIDIKICATAYIKAKSEEEALEFAKREFHSDCGMELPDDLHWLEVPITGMSYDHPDLPDVSLSPAMSFHGPFDGDKAIIELVEEDVPGGNVFSIGDSVVLLVETEGSDHEDKEHKIGAGAIGTIDSIDGDAYTVVIPVDAGDEHHIVNVFDEEDGPITDFLAHEEESDAVS